MTVVYYGRHESYTLSNLLAKGGEGEVYEIIGKPNLVAKIYFEEKFSNSSTSPNSRTMLEKKIETMLDQPVNPYINGVLTVAWPQDLLLDANGQFVGFTMPKVKSQYHIFTAYRETERKELFPNYTWRTAVLIAYNLAVAVKIVHDTGALIGDMNPNNIMLSQDGSITLIDCDSFNIKNKKTGREYKCTVGMGEVLPPELQGKNLDAPYTHFSEESDDFALAIHIFNLLMNNSHPFGCLGMSELHSSSASNPIVYNITKGNCPYVKGEQGTSEAPDFRLLPSEIRDLFDRVFNYTVSTAEKVSTISRRPKASEWKNALFAILCNSCNTASKNVQRKAWPLWLFSICLGAIVTPFMVPFFKTACSLVAGYNLSVETVRVILALVGALTGTLLAHLNQDSYINDPGIFSSILICLTVPFAALAISIIIVLCLKFAFGFISLLWSIVVVILEVVIVLTILRTLFGI